MDKVFSQLSKYLIATATRHEALYEIDGRYAMRYCIDPRHDALCKTLIYALEKSIKLAAYIPLESNSESKIGAILLLVYHLWLIQKADRAVAIKPIFELSDRMTSVMATMFNADSCRTNKKDPVLWEHTLFTMKALELNIDGLQFRAAIIRILEMLANFYMKDCVYITEISEARLGSDRSRPMISPDSFTAIFRAIMVLMVKTVS